MRAIFNFLFIISLLFALSIEAYAVSCANTGTRIYADPVNRRGPITLIRANTILQPRGCTMDGGIMIDRPNISLDCNGAILNGESVDYNTQAKAFYAGINILQMANDNLTDIVNRYRSLPTVQERILDVQRNYQIRNVEVRNCTVKNFFFGVHVGWKLYENYRLELFPRSPEGDYNSLWAAGPQGNILRNIQVESPKNDGIFIDAYSTNSQILNSSVNNSKIVGVYLEYNTKNTLIQGGRFTNNKVGIAVDSSLDNSILFNTISANREGGVFLYKNCTEQGFQMPNPIWRTQPSDNNRIGHNHFSSQPKGVWIASRQSKDQSIAKCGDASPYPDRAVGGWPKYFLDYAKHNWVTHNQFVSVKEPVIVEDSFNYINDNVFKGSFDFMVKYGTILRDTRLDRPVTDLQILRNVNQGKLNSGGVPFRAIGNPRNIHFSGQKLNLSAVAKANTGSGLTEVHTLSAVSNYQSFSRQQSVALSLLGKARADYRFADFDRDGIKDMFAIIRSQTGSRMTEVHVLSGASHYQTFSLHAATPIGETPNDGIQYEMTDWDLDGIPDLATISASTITGKFEIHVLSGASGYSKWIAHMLTAFPAQSKLEFKLADWDIDGKMDLVAIKRLQTGSHSTEIHILSAASYFRNFILQTGTAIAELPLANAQVDFRDWDEDGIPDLIAILKKQTGSGKTEVHVISGKNNGRGAFADFIYQQASSLSATDNSWDIQMSPAQ